MVSLDILSFLFLNNDILFYNFKLLSNNLNLFVNYVIIFLVCMLISFGFEYSIGESYMKKYKEGK